MMWRRWLSGFFVVAIVAILAAIVMPYVLHLREEARSTQSRDNLHNLGLALQNYHLSNVAFPPGGIIRADGVAMHGWCTSLLPYIDSNPLSAAINFHYPWDDAENAHLFSMGADIFRIPGAELNATSEGFDLTHYLANPNVLHRNSNVRARDLSAGAKQTWILGEVDRQYRPRGYPFNWRPLGTRLNSGPDSFGRPTGDGAHLLMADGSVSFVANDAGSDVLGALGNAPPVATRDQKHVPAREFTCRNRRFEIKRLEFDPQEFGLRAKLWMDDAGKAEFAWITADKGDWRAPMIEDVRDVAQEFPEIRRLFGGPFIDDAIAGELPTFRNLALVKAPGIDVSDVGIASLAQMPQLRMICVETVDQSLLDRLTRKLPNCTIRVTDR